MVERIIEILIYLIKKIDTYNFKDKNEKFESLDIKPLFEKGYTDSEISTALNWIHDNYPLKFSIPIQKINKNFRILTEEEQEAFTPEAYNELLQLNAFGMISNYDMETILERAMLSNGNPITKEQLLNFIALTVFNAEWNLGDDKKLSIRMNNTIH